MNSPQRLVHTFIIAAILCVGASGRLQAEVVPAVASPIAATTLHGAVLDYPSVDHAAAPVYDPTGFGTAPVAQAQADAIVRAWRREPVTLPWTSLMLTMIVKHKIAPTRAARGSALLHVAMYDAMLLAPDEESRRVAVSSAATQVLAYWFTAEEHGFDRVLGGVLLRLAAEGASTPAQQAASLALGRRIGRRVVARGESDGAQRGWNGVRLQYYGEGRYYGPGAWQPTPSYFYYPPDEPFAPTWKTWVLASADQFRPTPPAFGSERFMRDLEEVVAIQKNLTPAQRRIAEFWVDGSGSVTPPGHWNQIAIELVREDSLGAVETARMFALLNMALADAFIAGWDTKYHYWTGRPVTLAKVVLGIDFKPAILTPPFPSYLSGHAAFSGAGARVLGAFYPRQAHALNAMAEEAAMSRLYGGIHYRHDNEDGLTLGRTVADAVLHKLNR